MASAWSLYLFFGFLANNEPLELGMYVKFVIGTDHSRTYKMYVKYRSQVNNYEHGDSAKLWFYVRQI
jgi:hypothetical protein